MRPGRFLADEDTSVAHLRALGLFLNGRHSRSPSLRAGRGSMPRWMGKAVSPDQLAKFDAEAAARWMVRRYPERRVPSIFIGSSSGAQVHLCAALGVPWLPQTLLLSVRSSVSADHSREALESGRQLAPLLLDRNPEVVLHHLYDPAEDRLRPERRISFRVKRTRLGEAWSAFIRRVLPPGGTIFVSECRRAWPVTRVGPRHVFQMGALGGLAPEEFVAGSDEVSEYLEEEGAFVRQWNPPEPTELAPEAEWGFEPSLLADIAGLARANGYRVCRVLQDEPEDLSPLVADLYLWWYRQRRIEPLRLVVECSRELEPYWVLRTGSVPFWMKFSMEDDADRLEEYLDASPAWQEIYLLFQRGMEGPGLAPRARWRELLARARKNGAFLGPHHRELGALPPRYPLPGRMALGLFERFLAEYGGRSPVQWVEHETAGTAPVPGPAPAVPERA